MAGALKRMATAEGEALPMGEKGFAYQYFLKDHLGNVRAVIRDDDTGSPEVIQAKTYYPFGMVFTSEMMQGTIADKTNPYLFNGKEQQEMPGLWYDYGARMYDAQLGRWHTVDHFAKKYQNFTPYAYVRNNPILRLDPNGMWDVTVHVYNDRKQHGYGVAIVTDRNGNEVYRFNVRAEGTGGRDRTKTNADTPLGVYDIPDNNAWLTGGSRASYGPNARLNMVGESGEITKSGRGSIRIHGGRQDKYNSKTKKWEPVDNPTLKKTHGCLRAYDSDMASFKQITDNLQANDDKEVPGQVTVSDDLEQVNEPSEDNYVEVKVTYQVPANELNYWQNLVNNLLNNNNNGGQ